MKFTFGLFRGFPKKESFLEIQIYKKSNQLHNFIKKKYLQSIITLNKKMIIYLVQKLFIDHT